GGSGWTRAGRRCWCWRICETATPTLAWRPGWASAWPEVPPVERNQPRRLRQTRGTSTPPGNRGNLTGGLPVGGVCGAAVPDLVQVRAAGQGVGHLEYPVGMQVRRQMGGDVA